jgi:hypothetical protein
MTGNQQRATATPDEFAAMPSEVATAATRYQAFREVEAEHLALMASHNLLDDWTADIRLTVVGAREQVRLARDARASFRSHVRAFVRTMRAHREPLRAALRSTRTLLELLEQEGAIRSDGGWLEVEVLEWVIEDYGTNS